MKNKINLCFIVVDSNNNVFGYYHPGMNKSQNNPDSEIFLFTLSSNGRSGKKKLNNIDPMTYTTIESEEDYF